MNCVRYEETEPNISVGEKDSNEQDSAFVSLPGKVRPDEKRGRPLDRYSGERDDDPDDPGNEKTADDIPFPDQ